MELGKFGRIAETLSNGFRKIKVGTRPDVPTADAEVFIAGLHAEWEIIEGPRERRTPPRSDKRPPYPGR